MGILQRAQSAWSAFKKPDEHIEGDVGGIYSFGQPPYQATRTYRQDSITTPVFNRIALDVAMIDFTHVKIDATTGEQKNILDSLHMRLNRDANIDQTGKAFMQDLVFSILEEGVAAIVPIDTDTSIIDLQTQGSFNIESWRVGRIVQWYPQQVKVEVYNDINGSMQQLLLPKRSVAIIQNPLYGVTNGPNSTLARLKVAIQQLDQNDAAILSNKFNMIIQLPYTVRNEKKKAEADERVRNLEAQLANNRFGVAYSDATEKITQLNRPLSSNFLEKADQLAQEFLNQLGLTKGVFDGSADEVQMKNYFSRSIDAIANAILQEINRKFLTNTALTQGHQIITYRDPFTLVATEKIADMAKTLIDARIVRPNEMRPKFGLTPIPKEEDPIASTLANPNVDTVSSVGAVAGSPQQDPGSIASPDDSQNGEVS